VNSAHNGSRLVLAVAPPKPLVPCVQPGVAVVLHTHGIDGRDDGQQQADADPDRGGHDDQPGDRLATRR